MAIQCPLNSGHPAIVICLLILQITATFCKSIGFTEKEVASERSEVARNNHLEAEVERLSMAVERAYEEMEKLRGKLEESHTSSKHRQLVPKISCRSETTTWQRAVGLTLEYLDNFDVHCRDGEFLRQWRMSWGERAGLKSIRFVCCRFSSLHEEKSHRELREGKSRRRKSSYTMS